MNKKLLLSTAMAATLMAACSQQPANQFTLKGTINGMENEYIYLSYLQDSIEVQDSALIKNGNFKFEGKLIKPTSASLHPKMSPHQRYVPEDIYSFFIEPAKMSIDVDTADFSKAHLTGSLTQAQVDTLFTNIQGIMDEAKEIREAINAETDHEKQAELREQLEPFNKRVDKLYQAFITSHPASIASAQYLMFQSSGMNIEDIKKAYDSFTDEVKASQYAKEVAAEIAAQERVMPGKPAPDFATLDINGDSLKLSDFKGKYVILDFWASWCVPCRKSNPHMKELYKKYNSKGLEFIYVADNDSNPDTWRKAVKDDGIEAFHHVLRGMKIIDRSKMTFDRTNDISDKYAIHFLPTKYIIDKEGKIVGKFEDKELDDKLKEIFGF